MDDKFKNIKEQAAGRLQGIKEGVSSTTDRIKQMPGDAAAAATDKVRNASNNISTATSEKIHQWVQEFNAAVPAMKALGFSVKSFSVGIGLIPEINATLVGAVEALNQQKLQEMMEHTNNRALNALLGALQTAAKFKDQLTAIGIKGIEIDIKLGLPPLVTVNLLT